MLEIQNIDSQKLLQVMQQEGQKQNIPSKGKLK
jgi:hypothetical protein